MTATIINKFGKLTGWNELTFRAYGRNFEGINNVEYSDEVKMENEYGAGGYPIGQSTGNYEPKLTFDILSEELVAMQNSLPPSVRIQQIPPAPFIAVYELNGLITKDVCQNVTIKTIGKPVKQGDGKMWCKCECLLSHIDWNQP